MADVFLSYKRSDADAVSEIARQLKSLGLTVWFDASLMAGSTFNEEIDREARAAKAVLVCWSPDARASRWVIAEAMIGLEDEKLVACYVDGPDHFGAPTPFNTIHMSDLRDWFDDPISSDAGWRSVLGSIGHLCGRADLATWGDLDLDPSSQDIEDWIGSNRDSPLLMVAHSLASTAKHREEERAKYEAEIRAEYAARDEERRKESEAHQKEADERRAREQGPLPTFLGSIFAIPIFLVVFVLVSVLAYAGLILFQMLNLDPRGGGLTYGSQLFASAVSGYAGVQGGRAAIEAILKAWNGWPTFLVFVSCWIALFYIPLQVMDIATSWWSLVLAGLQCIVSVGTAFFGIARKADIS